MLSLPVGIHADAFVLSSSTPVAAFDAASVVLARVLLAKSESVGVHTHVGASVISGAIFVDQIVRVLFVGVVIENAARSFELHIEGLASLVLDAHLCAE